MKMTGHEMKPFHELYGDVTEFQKQFFPKSTWVSKLIHLKEELDEIAESDGKDIMEFADAFILLIGSAHAAGHDSVQILEAIEKKLEINKKRKWGEPDANGVVRHV